MVDESITGWSTEKERKIEKVCERMKGSERKREREKGKFYDRSPVAGLSRGVAFGNASGPP